MKTAMQELWDKIALKLSVEQVNEFLPEFDKALEKEKEQIIDAYERAITMYNEAEQPLEYYNKKYNQNK